MSTPRSRHAGCLAVLRRELSRLTRDWYLPVLLAVLPLAAFVLVWAIFARGVPRGLPMAVVDGDRSALSRQLVRMVDATPSMRVVATCADFESARRLILQNQVYGVVVVPEGLERDVRRGEAPKLVAYYNAQYLLAASLIRRDLRAAIATLSGGLELQAREARGEMPHVALAHVEPIRVDAHTLFNPQLNYLYYLAAALLPTLLQIFITVGTVHVVGVELKEGTAGGWLDEAGGSASRALIGKLLPYTIHFTVLGLFMLVLLFRSMAVPMHGHLSVLVAATVLFVLAYQAVGLAMVAWTANLRFAASATALYCAPAFAFVGITFPTIGMPPIGQVWGELLPLTHYLRVLVDQALRGSAPVFSMRSLGALSLFVVIPSALSVWRMRVVAASPQYLGAIVNTFGRALAAEFRRVIRDPGALLILVGAPFIYALFYPIPYRAQVLKHVPIVVVDQDQSDLSRKLTRMVDAHELTRVAEEAVSLAEAERAVRAGRAGGVLVIPAEFEGKVRRGEQAQVVAYADASYFLTYRQVLTGVLEATGTLSAGVEIKRLQAAGLPAARALKARDPLPLVMRPLFNPSEGYAGYVVPAVLVLILQQTLLVGIGVVAGTEWEQRRPDGPKGLWRAAPTVLGRATVYVGLYLVHALVYFGIVFHLLGFPQHGSARSLFLFATPFLVSVALLGLSARAVFHTREMALQVLLFTSLPALFLAGFAWPLEAVPRWLVVFSNALPSTAGIAGFLRLTQMGASLSDVRGELILLWALCGVYFVLAWAAEWRASTR